MKSGVIEVNGFKLVGGLESMAIENRVDSTVTVSSAMADKVLITFCVSPYFEISVQVSGDQSGANFIVPKVVVVSVVEFVTKHAGFLAVGFCSA